MDNSPTRDDTGDDTGVAPRRAPTTGTPRWVKVFGVITAVLILLVVAMMLIGGGSHGPGRHTPAENTGGHTPSSNVTEDHTPPEGGHG